MENKYDELFKLNSNFIIYFMKYFLFYHKIIYFYYLILINKKIIF